MNDAWWVSTKEFLPDIDERVLIITKWGHVTNAMYTDMGMGGEPSFRPDGLKPNKDVKWWMPTPTDGWKDIKIEQPQEGEAFLTMGMYGDIFNGIWKRAAGEKTPSFHPFVWPVLFWREIPELPAGVNLNY